MRKARTADRRALSGGAERLRSCWTAHSSLGEGRHVAVHRASEAQDRERRGGARALSEPHAEREHRFEFEVLEQRTMGGLGREVAGEQAGT